TTGFVDGNEGAVDVFAFADDIEVADAAAGFVEGALAGAVGSFDAVGRGCEPEAIGAVVVAPGGGPGSVAGGSGAGVAEAEDVVAGEALADVGQGGFFGHGEVVEGPRGAGFVAGGGFAEKAVGVFVAAGDAEEVDGDGVVGVGFDEDDGAAVGG